MNVVFISSIVLYMTYIYRSLEVGLIKTYDLPRRFFELVVEQMEARTADGAG